MDWVRIKTFRRELSMPFHRFEEYENVLLTPHLSTAEAPIIEGKYLYYCLNQKRAGTGSELHYHPNELLIFPVLGKINAVGKKFGLTIANVFHAGDGNLHPLILYRYDIPEEVEATHRAGKEILSICIEYGGSLSGEHGIGLEKAPWMDSVYSCADLENMKRVRDFFNPDELLNPGKIFPSPGRCAEVKKQERTQTELDHTRMVASKTGIAV